MILNLANQLAFISDQNFTIEGSQYDTSQLEINGVSCRQLGLMPTLSDKLFVDILDIFKEIKVITEEGGKVLLHSNNDPNRALKFAACYLVFNNNMPSKEAIEKVKFTENLLKREIDVQFVKSFSKSLNLTSF